MFNFRIVYLAQLSTSLISKSKLGYVLSKIKEILKIEDNGFVLLLIIRRYFLGHSVDLSVIFLKLQ